MFYLYQTVDQYLNVAFKLNVSSNAAIKAMWVWFNSTGSLNEIIDSK